MNPISTNPAQICVQNPEHRRTHCNPPRPAPWTVQLQQLLLRRTTARIHTESGQHQQPKPLRGSQTSYYDILGVPQQASLEDIKKAFRQKALELHPDAAQSQGRQLDAAAFIRIASAYEVLGDAQKRKEYDLQLSGSLSSDAKWTSRDPTSSQTSSTSQASHRPTDDSAKPPAKGTPLDELKEDLANWRYGIGDWVMNQLQGTGHLGQQESYRRYKQTEALKYYAEKFKADIQQELATKLLKAYYGPKLSLKPGQMVPKCFEAEERRDPSIGSELLHLVSGRTLLGVVRIRKGDHDMLEGPDGAYAILPGQNDQDLLAQLSNSSMMAHELSAAETIPLCTASQSSTAHQQGSAGEFPSQSLHASHFDDRMHMDSNSSSLHQHAATNNPIHTNSDLDPHVSRFANVPSAHDQTQVQNTARHHSASDSAHAQSSSAWHGSDPMSTHDINRPQSCLNYKAWDQHDQSSSNIHHSQQPAHTSSTSAINHDSSAHSHNHQTAMSPDVANNSRSHLTSTDGNHADSTISHSMPIQSQPSSHQSDGPSNMRSPSASEHSEHNIPAVVSKDQTSLQKQKELPCPIPVTSIMYHHDPLMVVKRRKAAPEVKDARDHVAALTEADESDDEPEDDLLGRERFFKWPFSNNFKGGWDPVDHELAKRDWLKEISEKHSAAMLNVAATANTWRASPEALGGSRLAARYASMSSAGSSCEGTQRVSATPRAPADLQSILGSTLPPEYLREEEAKRRSRQLKKEYNEALRIKLGLDPFPPFEPEPGRQHRTQPILGPSNQQALVGSMTGAATDHLTTMTAGTNHDSHNSPSDAAALHSIHHTNARHNSAGLAQHNNSSANITLHSQVSSSSHYAARHPGSNTTSTQERDNSTNVTNYMGEHVTRTGLWASAKRMLRQMLFLEPLRDVSAAYKVVTNDSQSASAGNQPNPHIQQSTPTMPSTGAVMAAGTHSHASPAVNSQSNATANNSNDGGPCIVNKNSADSTISDKDKLRNPNFWDFNEHSPNVVVLELVQQGRVVAVGIKEAPIIPDAKARIKMYHEGQLIAGIFGNLVYDDQGRRIGICGTARLPGLDAVRVYDYMHGNMRMVCEMLRGRLLPSWTWVFNPRKHSHDIGGWYIEWRGYKHSESPRWIHPSILILLSGFLSLEREQRKRHDRQRWKNLMASIDRWTSGWKSPKGAEDALISSGNHQNVVSAVRHGR